MDDAMSNIFPRSSSSFPRNAARALDPDRERQRRLASTSKEFVSDVERLCEVVVVADVSILFVIGFLFFVIRSAC